MTKKEFLKRIERAKEKLRNKEHTGACHAISSAFNGKGLKNEDNLDIYNLFNYTMKFEFNLSHWLPVDFKHIKIRCEMIDHFADTIIELGWHKFIELEG